MNEHRGEPKGDRRMMTIWGIAFVILMILVGTMAGLAIDKARGDAVAPACGGTCSSSAPKEVGNERRQDLDLRDG